MKVLITGARGFVGKNLTAQLKNCAAGRAACDARLSALTLYECDLDTPGEQLAAWCRDCDFVIHLAGVNRPKETGEFMTGNCDFTKTLLNLLKESNNPAPVLLSSSIQAALDNPYGASKRAAEDAVLAYGRETGAAAYVYRLPNVFGKWCRPNYNSAVATFCHNIARDLPITVNDPTVLMRLVYIDDVVAAFIAALCGGAHRDDDGFCFVPTVHTARLGEIADAIRRFHGGRADLSLPRFDNAFERALYSTYLSYLPADALAYPLTTHADARGSFTEILRTEASGQFSVNISKPGIKKGSHWHHTKAEKFLVVAGHGRIRLRRVDSAEIAEYAVSGDALTVVDIIPGCTHDIINDGDTDMVTFMWCSECFDPGRPDTYSLEV